MSTTVNTVTKDAKKLLKSLTPEEKAGYMSEEWWRIGDERGKGHDITAQKAELEKIEWDLGTSMDAADSSRYFQEQWNLDTREWGARYFYSVLAGLELEDLLISIILLEKDRALVNEVLEPKPVKEDPIWKELQKTSRKQVLMFRKRRQDIAKEIKDILAADFWEIQNIPRPVMKERPLRI